MKRTKSSLERIYLDKDREKPAIYFLYKNNIIIYIGKSRYPEYRISIHKKRMKDDESFEFDSYSLMQCEENQLSKLEAKMIFKYLPKHNKTISALKSLIGVYSVGYIENTKKIQNKEYVIPVKVIGRRLYIDLTDTNIILIKKK